MPSTSGAVMTAAPAGRAQARPAPAPERGGELRGIQRPPHHQRVRAARLVVAPAQADIGESVPAVQPLRPRVVHPDLKEHLGAALGCRLG